VVLGVAMVSNLSFGSSVDGHRVLTGPPDPRQHPFGSGQLCGTASGGAGHQSRLPVAFRLPALAFWIILCPLGNWTFPAVGLRKKMPPDPIRVGCSSAQGTGDRAVGWSAWRRQ